jgi:hypothetical protein
MLLSVDSVVSFCRYLSVVLLLCMALLFVIVSICNCLFFYKNAILFVVCYFCYERVYVFLSIAQLMHVNYQCWIAEVLAPCSEVETLG